MLRSQAGCRGPGCRRLESSATPLVASAPRTGGRLDVLWPYPETYPPEGEPAQASNRICLTEWTSVVSSYDARQSILSEETDEELLCGHNRCVVECRAGQQESRVQVHHSQRVAVLTNPFPQPEMS